MGQSERPRPVSPKLHESAVSGAARGIGLIDRVWAAIEYELVEE